MNGNKGTENATGKKDTGESKIPKPTKFSTAKEKSSKAPVEKKTTESRKTTVRAVAMHSKVKQTKVPNLPKNVKPMSIAKISKDVMNHLQTENLKSEDHVAEYVSHAPVLDKEDATKRVQLKEKASQKQSGNRQEGPTASAAFGGMKFIPKGNTCLKSDIFPKMRKESKKDCEEAHPTEPRTKEIKTTDSAKATASKEIDRSKKENLQNTLTNEAGSSKPTPLTVKENALNSTAFGGMRFVPKWKSTPLRPYLFDNVQKEFKHVELSPIDSFPKQLKKIPGSANATIKKETGQSNAKKLEASSIPESSKNVIAKNVEKAIPKPTPTFAGMRFKTSQKNLRDVFESQKAKNNQNQS